MFISRAYIGFFQHAFCLIDNWLRGTGNRKNRETCPSAWSPHPSRTHAYTYAYQRKESRDLMRNGGKKQLNSKLFSMKNSRASWLETGNYRFNISSPLSAMTDAAETEEDYRKSSLNIGQIDWISSEGVCVCMSVCVHGYTAVRSHARGRQVAQIHFFLRRKITIEDLMDLPYCWPTCLFFQFLKDGCPGPRGLNPPQPMILLPMINQSY